MHTLLTFNKGKIEIIPVGVNNNIKVYSSSDKCINKDIVQKITGENYIIKSDDDSAILNGEAKYLCFEPKHKMNGYIKVSIVNFVEDKPHIRIEQ